ncbi:MAG: protein kinase [Myxococcales bacterium]|nr:protein kinase [Myxococcales bacterium]
MSQPSALRPGDVLGGRYVIAATLGEGASSVVYRARDRFEDREVAVKVSAAGADLSAELVAALDAGHPVLVRALGVGSTPSGHAYLVLELATGSTPDRALAGRDAAETVAVLLDRVLDGLGCLHARGVVHGDVKPANLRVDLTGGRTTVRLLDLGLARAGHASAGGTLAYAAPECLGAGARDARADLFSLGVVAYELLAGALPFGDPDDPGYLARALAGEAAPLPDAVPPGLAAVVRRLLQADPAARYATAWEARAALRDAVRSIPDAPEADVEPRLVGRDEALETLRGLMAQARAGRGALARLDGPPGSGRSRLLVRATLDAALAGLGTLELRASLGAPEFLRALLTQGASLPGGEACAAALARLGGAPSDPHAAWLDAAEALRALASRSPLWVAVHAADAADRDVSAMLDFIARGEAPIVWVGAWRPGGALAEASAAVALRALRGPEVASMIASMLPGLPAVDELARAAHDRTAGLPGPVRDGVVELRRAGVVRLLGGRWRVSGPLPSWAFDPTDGARDDRALAAMPPEARATLGVLHLAGSVDGLAALAALAAVPLAAARGAVEHGLAAGVVRREGTRLRVASAALGDVLAGALPDARRAAVHRRALAAWSDATGPAAHRARSAHLQALGETVSAAAEALRAARALAAAGALHEADVCFRRAQDLGDAAPSSADAHGDALAAAGRLDEALAAYGRAAALGAPEGASALRRARALAGVGRFPEALDALGDEAAGPEGDFWRGWCLMMAGRYDEAEACARSIPADPADRLRRARLLGTVAWHRGDAARGVELLRAAQEECAGVDDATLRAEVEMALATALGLGGAGSEAAEGYRRASAGFRGAGRVAQVARCENNLAIEEYQSGRWEAARLGWEACLDLSQRLGDPAEELLGHNNLGMLWKDRGELARAEGCFGRALDIARARGLRRFEAMALGNRGEARALAGELAAAGDDLTRAEALATAVGARDEALEARRRRAALRLAHGDARGALALAREVAAIVAAEGQRQEEGCARMVAAAAARALGQLDAAASEAAAARAAFSVAGTGLDRARLDLETAHLATAQGDPALARALATRSASVFADLGAQRELEEAQALARGRGQGDVFLRMAEAVAEAPTAGAMLGRALDALLALTGAERGFVVLLAGLEGPRLAAARYVGDAAHEAPRLSHGIAERVIASRRPLVLTDVGDDADLAARASVAHIGLRAALAAPLMRRGECLGLLYLDSTRGVADLARWGLYPLEVAAAIVAPALDLMLAREDERERARVLVGTAHGLLDAVAAIDASLELVAEEDDPLRRGALAADARARCAELVARADGVLELVQHEDVEAGPDAVDLRAVVRYALGPGDGGLALVTGEQPVMVRAEIQTLTRAVAQLCEVAAQGAGPAAVVTVEVSTGAVSGAPAVLGWRPAPRDGVGWARLTVAHEGAALDGAGVAGLFDPSGCGGERAVRLCAARRVVRGYGGLLWAEGRAGGGVRYVAEIPVAGSGGGSG